MLRSLLNRLNFGGRWRVRQAERRRFDALAAEYHRQERERIAKMAAEGRSHEALQESLSALGINQGNDKARVTAFKGRIVGYNGKRFRDSSPHTS
jgi:hypothetical protein